MKFTPNDPPRTFQVGYDDNRVTLRDCGRIDLAADEQVTFTTSAGGEYDVVRKSWGFYATPSLNARLPGFGLRALLAEGPKGDRFFLLLVEKGKEAEFERYMQLHGMKIVCWLDTDEACVRLKSHQAQG
jgi:hypothetical protein